MKGHSPVKKTIRKWRLRIILWSASFLFGLITDYYFTLGILLLGFLSLYLMAPIVRAANTQYWAAGQLLGHIRGIIVCAFTPTLFTASLEYWETREMETLIEISLILVLILIIWLIFNNLLVKITLKKCRR